MRKTTSMLMLLAGCFGLAVAGSPSVKVLAALLRAGRTAAPSTVADAGVDRWVALTDAKLRCDRRTVYKDSTTFFLATDTGLANPFLAQFMGKVTCEEAQARVNGAFVPEPLGAGELKRYGVDADGATRVRFFTETAAPKYLRLVLVPLGVVLLLGFGLFAFGLRGVLQARRAPRP